MGLRHETALQVRQCSYAQGAVRIARCEPVPTDVGPTCQTGQCVTRRTIVRSRSSGATTVREMAPATPPATKRCIIVVGGVKHNLCKQSTAMSSHRDQLCSCGYRILAKSDCSPSHSPLCRSLYASRCSTTTAYALEAVALMPATCIAVYHSATSKASTAGARARRPSVTLESSQLLAAPVLNALHPVRGVDPRRQYALLRQLPLRQQHREPPELFEADLRCGVRPVMQGS